MSYTPPAGNSANLQFGTGYSAPAGNAADLSFEQPAAGVSGTGTFDVGFTVAGAASHGVAGTGAFSVGFDVAGEAEYQSIVVVGDGAFSVDFAPAGEAAHGVAGAGNFTLDFSPVGTVAHGVAGAGAVSIGFGIAGEAVHERYELRGEVRYQGVLVNRQVRAYRRDTGELVGQAMTPLGRFAVPVGFAPAEHYIIPIDPANDAEDFAPPTANRVMSVLAMDAA